MIDRRTLDEKAENPTDVLKWIRNIVIVTDRLTKAMPEDLMRRVLDTNYWNYEQTDEAETIKARKQAQRSMMKKQVSEPELESEPHDSDPEQGQKPQISLSKVSAKERKQMSGCLGVALLAEGALFSYTVFTLLK